MTTLSSLTELWLLRSGFMVQRRRRPAHSTTSSKLPATSSAGLAHHTSPTSMSVQSSMASWACCACLQAMSLISMTAQVTTCRSLLLQLT